MHRTSPLSFLAIVLGLTASCKPEVEERPVAPSLAVRAVAELRAIKDATCACRDAACLEAVAQRLTAWSGGPGAELTNSPIPDRKQSAELPALWHELQACMASVTSALAAAPPDAGVESDAPPVLRGVPAKVAAPYPADALLRAAREWLATAHPKLVPAQATLAYVDRDGNLDAEHGRFELQVGYVSEKVDDPRRKTGAPVVAAERPSSCPKIVWQAGAWDVRSWSCREVLPHVPRCPAANVWSRAIAKGAPADALAVITLEYRDRSAPPRWAFAISDDLRGVKIRHAFDDDCPLAVEQPASP